MLLKKIVFGEVNVLAFDITSFQLTWLKQGSFLVCGGCRTPISSLDKKSNMYEKGVSCHSVMKNLQNIKNQSFE